MRFSVGPIETTYLNEDRVRERFVSHHREIKDFTLGARRTAAGEIRLFGAKAGASRDETKGVTYGLEDPLTQALALRHALEQQPGAVAQPGDDNVAFGGYLVASGKPFLYGVAPDKKPSDLKFLPSAPDVPAGAFDELLAARAEQEQFARIGDPTARMWLLVLLGDDGSVVAAAVVPSKWLERRWGSIGSYIAHNWEVFGVVERVVDGVPLLTALHATVQFDAVRPE